MNCKKINKKYHKLTSSFNLGIISRKSESGIIYTLYSEKFDSIEIGFAENESILERDMFLKESILLDKKSSEKNKLNLLLNTLSELGVIYSDNLNFKYSKSLMRHLHFLGWPVGSSLFKPRKIKKELSCA